MYTPGTLSYVPSGQLYGYEITKPSKLLHVFFANPKKHVKDGTDLPAGEA